jgi:hypothetical protein
MYAIFLLLFSIYSNNTVYAVYSMFIFTYGCNNYYISMRGITSLSRASGQIFPEPSFFKCVKRRLFYFLSYDLQLFIKWNLVRDAARGRVQL